MRVEIHLGRHGEIRVRYALGSVVLLCFCLSSYASSSTACLERSSLILQSRYGATSSHRSSVLQRALSAPTGASIGVR